MKYAGLYSTLLALCLVIPRAQSQVVQPPHLQCLYVLITGDIKVDWSLPANSCGPFNAYYLYRSTNFTGPYSLAASITNEFQTTYTDNVGNGTTVTYYYYMVSDYNCPGATFPASDTLDNLDPVPPMIDYVTVNNGIAEMYWQPSPSPEVYGYIIYQVVDGLYLPIDTVLGAGIVSYSDPNSTPNGDTMSYTIATIDSCINTGPINESPQHTVFLDDTVLRCQQTILLDWTAYDNWPQGVKEYQLYVATNGGVPVLTATLPPDSLSYILTGVDDGDQLCITVIAEENNTGFLSVSNEKCIQFNVVQPANDFFIRNVTVTPGQAAQVFYSMDEKADLLELEVLRGIDSNNLVSLDHFSPPPDLSIINAYLDTTADVRNLRYYYRLVATDSCGNRDTSTLAWTILLEGYAFSDLTFYTTWNVSYIEYGTVDEYRIYRDDGQGPLWVATVDPTVLVYEETEAPVTMPCYLVEAVVSMDLPTGIQEQVFSRSNTICLNQPSQIYMPNAFAPEGKNNVFKPIINVEEINAYSFMVFSRWGEQLFSSTDPEEGWNGKYKGFLVQQGAYAYLVQLVDEKGKQIEAKGTVLVVR